MEATEDGTLAYPTSAQPKANQPTPRQRGGRTRSASSATALAATVGSIASKEDIPLAIISAAGVSQRHCVIRGLVFCAT